MRKLFSILSLIFLAFVHCVPSVLAQQSVNSAGGKTSGSGGNTYYSVGQVVFSNLNSGVGSVSQGVQQPFEIQAITGIESALGIQLLVSAYPNPAADFLILEIDATTSFSNKSLRYQLYDMQGKLLIDKDISSTQTKIDMNILLPAIYFLNVSERKIDTYVTKTNKSKGEPLMLLKTFRIIKK